MQKHLPLLLLLFTILPVSAQKWIPLNDIGKASSDDIILFVDQHENFHIICQDMLNKPDLDYPTGTPPMMGRRSPKVLPG
jgi:hypothetical protein